MALYSAANASARARSRLNRDHRSRPAGRTARRSVKVEETNGVVGHHQADLVVGHASEVLRYHPIRMWKLRFLVWKIGRPDQLVDTHQVAQADSDAVLLEAPQDVLLQVLRRCPG